MSKTDYNPTEYKGFELTINGGEDNKIVARLSGSHPSLNGWVMDFQITKSGKVLGKNTHIDNQFNQKQVVNL